MKKEVKLSLEEKIKALWLLRINSQFGTLKNRSLIRKMKKEIAREISKLNKKKED